jgi:hypothetical protein
MSMDMERPLILYQVIEVETVRNTETDELQTYIHTRSAFADKERAKQERKEIRKAKKKEFVDPVLIQESCKVAVRRLKISPRTIQEADRMDEERHRQQRIRAAMSGEYINQEEDNE